MIISEAANYQPGLLFATVTYCSQLTSSFQDLMAQSFKSVCSKLESHGIISLQTAHGRTGEYKVLIINHDNIIQTTRTFLMDQLSTITIAWRHLVTLPSNSVRISCNIRRVRLFISKILSNLRK